MVELLDEQIDIGQYCVSNPGATFLMRVSGNSMVGAGILDNDLVVVDRSLTPEQGDIVVANLNGGFTLKELRLKPTLALVPYNDSFPIMEVGANDVFEVFGVVVGVIRTLVNQRF